MVPPALGFCAEDLSALLDGEAAYPADTLAHVCSDPELRGKWSRYQLISDCLAGRYAESAGAAASPDPTAASFAPAMLRTPRGLAVAASFLMAFTAVAVYSLGDSIRQLVPVIATAPTSGEVDAELTAQRRLASYLVGHSEIAALGSPDKVLEYARVVAQAPQASHEE